MGFKYIVYIYIYNIVIVNYCINTQYIAAIARLEQKSFLEGSSSQYTVNHEAPQASRRARWLVFILSTAPYLAAPPIAPWRHKSGALKMES